MVRKKSLKTEEQQREGKSIRRLSSRIVAGIYALSFVLPVFMGDTVSGFEAFYLGWFLFPYGWISSGANFVFILAWASYLQRWRELAFSAAILSILCALVSSFILDGFNIFPGAGWLAWFGSMVLLLIAILMEEDWKRLR